MSDACLFLVLLFHRSLSTLHSRISSIAIAAAPIDQTAKMIGAKIRNSIIEKVSPKKVTDCGHSNPSHDNHWDH
jgi:hypothetical protein